MLFDIIGFYKSDKSASQIFAILHEISEYLVYRIIKHYRDTNGVVDRIRSGHHCFIRTKKVLEIVCS